MAALRFLGYMGVFLAGLAAIAVIVVALFEPRYVKTAGVLASLAYLFVFCAWTRRNDSRISRP